jgi:hypothetical protein
MTAAELKALEDAEHCNTCAHEAGHTAAALMLGAQPVGARADRVTVEEAITGDPNRPVGWVSLGDTDLNDHDLDAVRRRALVVLAGPLNEGHEPDRWPLGLAALTPDGRQLRRAVTLLGLDEGGYKRLVDDARELARSKEFKRSAAMIAELLAHGPLNRNQLDTIKKVAEEDPMGSPEWKTFPTKVTVLDPEYAHVREQARKAILADFEAAHEAETKSLQPTRVATFEV